MKVQHDINLTTPTEEDVERIKKDLVKTVAVVTGIKIGLTIATTVAVKFIEKKYLS